MISDNVPDKQFIARLQGSSLVTAHIIYRMPDYRSILQEFIWQDYDVFPQFPELRKFLRFWKRELDGPIHSLSIGYVGLVTEAEVRFVDRQFLIN